MPITLSPLDLLLDDENPRFVVLNSREQADIRKYLVTYEDVCDLAIGINDYGGILPGERVVVLKRGDKYVVVEGNRRTCSLQLLLNPTLIPDGFRHRIPTASDKLKSNCHTIEVDIVPNREAALELMTKRHIEGVKQWKPLAKKQFFASNYSAGHSVSNLSRITGMSESAIKTDIRDYNFFLSAYTEYCSKHPAYHGQIVDLKIDPFLRVFKAKFPYNGADVKPVDILRISYTQNHDVLSGLPSGVFFSIVQTAFEEATITEQINTRNTLKDVTGVIAALDAFLQVEAAGGANTGGSTTGGTATGGTATGSTATGGTATGGPSPGGPAPRTFFETLSWDQKLTPSKPEHEGLLAAVHELYNLSTTCCGRKKAYEVFPIATGMVLRTAYEQVLTLRLKQTNLWSKFMQEQRSKSFPTLSKMETFIDKPENKPHVLPSVELQSALTLTIRYSHREFLNANIHSPGDIHVTAESLSAIANSGMFTLIQDSINLL